MICKNCGKEIRDDATFCTSCGKTIDGAPTGDNTTYTPSYKAPVVVDGNTSSFLNSIKLIFQNYANFTGRTKKSDFWWGFLFLVIVSAATAYIPIIGSVISVALFIPNLSLCIRRLHDVGKSWTWILMGLIPLVGLIVLIVLYCKDSDGNNQWGLAE